MTHAYLTWDDSAAVKASDVVAESHQLAQFSRESMAREMVEAAERMVDRPSRQHAIALAGLACCIGWFSAEGITALLVKKQHDYGHGNILKFGADGVVVRLWDKIARYKNLTKRSTSIPMNESLDDTLMDIIGYSVIWMMIDDNTFVLPLKQDLVSETNSKVGIQPHPWGTDHKLDIQMDNFDDGHYKVDVHTYVDYTWDKNGSTYRTDVTPQNPALRPPAPPQKRIIRIQLQGVDYEISGYQLEVRQVTNRGAEEIK